MSDFSKTTQSHIKSEPKKPNSLLLGFLGGLAGCNAEAVTFPFDNLKTRMQMNGKEGMPSYKSFTDCITQTFKAKGIPGFYKGASAAFLRQLTYSTVRMWAYEKINRYFSADVEKVGFFRKLFAGGLGGAVGCLVGTPFDIFKIRLINDILGKKYSNLRDCYRQTIEKDGLIGLFKGMNVNVVRAILVNAAELAFYDKSKYFFTTSPYFLLDQNSILTHLFSSCVSGFMGAVFSSPADVVKTRYMNQLQGQEAYKGVIDCALRLFKTEGLMVFYRGFIPLYLRIGPWNVAFFLSYEKYKSYILPIIYKY